MTEKQFVYYEHKGADYILDTPNTELDFIEMLGDALEPEEIVDKLNELSQLNYNLTENAREYQKIARVVDKQNKQLEKENKELKHENVNIMSDLDYYRVKSGSCEEGLFQKDREIAKLEQENRTLKLLVQNWEQLDDEKDEQLEKMNGSLKRLVEENKQLQQELFESEVDYYTETFRDDYEDRIIDLKKEFKERFGRDFEYD